MRLATGLAFSVFAATLCTLPVGARQVVVSMTSERVAEAIDLGRDDQAARRFLGAFVIQSHRTVGDGPRLGEFSTPFSRVVRRAAQAKKAGHDPVAADIRPELLAPEVHVIVVPRETADGKPASVQSITIWRAGQEVRPVRTQDLNAAYREAFEVDVAGDGVVAVFPLDVFAEASQIIVHLDKVAKGFSTMSGCRDCVIPVPIRQMK